MTSIVIGAIVRFLSFFLSVAVFLISATMYIGE